MSIRISFYISLFIIFSQSLLSQKSLPDTAFASIIDNDINIDGILNEKEWNLCKKISNFHQRETNEGAEITEKTEVGILFNNNKIYIGVWCWDSEPNKLVSKEMVRDFEYWRDDNFEIIFDTYLDKRNGYVFVVNPNGAMADVQITNEGNGFNINWNTVWDAATEVNENGWFAEIEIPFSSLKFPNSNEQIWGVNFERNIRRKQEAAFWQGWSRNYDFEHVSHAGTLKGLKNIKSNELFELKPFITGGVQFLENSDFGKILKIGGDANLFITPGVKLNLTFNTDFAQVESDQLQFNLTRFNLFIPEKRDIFLEGKDFFDYNIDGNTKTIYTRKIGINENGSEKPILAGAKITGIQGRTSIGFMSFQDKADTINPSTNFSVLRIKQSIFEKSSIGMVLTSLNNSKISNYVWGLDFNYTTSKLFEDKNFEIGAHISQSITNSKSSDAYAYSVNSSFRNDIVNSGISFSNVKNNYSPQIGFLRRTNYKQISYDFTYKFRLENSEYLQFIYISPLNSSFYFTDTSNQSESITLHSSPIGIMTKSGDMINLYIKREYDRADEPLESINRPKGEYWFGVYGIEIETFEGRWWKTDIEYSRGTYYGGIGNELYFNLRINANNRIAFNIEYGHTDLDFNDSYFLKNYVSLNTEVGITPKLFTNLYAQWLDISNELILNYRIHWTPIPGSDVYFVFNQNYQTEKIFKLLNTTISAKILWRFPVGF